ncbi:hypothetical protein [Micromonospora carbonacea]|uniref:Uncharacterized protein n=1 Tax=Micromonospora carbonacea TaxID=47853 RepID=A0A1C5AD41_9ACTN|nr:hypothetical protein [Micromonospora carbonacea]SCF43172.1 hypothetical protein GA0070563_112198 [Micromonospora carbonacea]
MTTNTTIPPTSRVLPGPSDDMAWTPGLVAAIAHGVNIHAHNLAHPVPQHGCPFGACADADVPFRDGSAEVSWLEDAASPPVRHEVAA